MCRARLALAEYLALKAPFEVNELLIVIPAECGTLYPWHKLLGRTKMRISLAKRVFTEMREHVDCFLSYTMLLQSSLCSSMKKNSDWKNGHTVNNFQPIERTFLLSRLGPKIIQKPESGNDDFLLLCLSLKSMIFLSYKNIWISTRQHSSSALCLVLTLGMICQFTTMRRQLHVLFSI